jgi:hypothetical protein
MAGAAVRRETVRITQATAAMSNDLSPELALVAVEAAPLAREGSARERRHRRPRLVRLELELRRGLDVNEDWFGDGSRHGWIERSLAAQCAAAGRTASPSASTAIA